MHSFWPWRIGREATLLDLGKLTYKNIINSIRTGEGLTGTIEVDPFYGKYHYDGHRNCNISFSPKQTLAHNKICPVCKRPLTIGVEFRVEELADRAENFLPENPKKFYTLIPLSEILSKLLNCGVATKKIWAEYYKLVNDQRNEMDVLLNLSYEELLKLTDKRIADVIMMNREGKIKVKPGYDGEYGVPVFDDSVEEKKEKIKKHPQKSLGEF